MSGTVTDKSHQLKLSIQDSEAKAQRTAELRAIALNRSLDMETRLLAFWSISAAIWKARTASQVGDNPKMQRDRMVATKTNSERRRLDRATARRAALGLTIRPRTGRTRADIIIIGCRSTLPSFGRGTARKRRIGAD
jgi:hypothetical protein